jgi:hypothetical protein
VTFPYYYVKYCIVLDYRGLPSRDAASCRCVLGSNGLQDTTTNTQGRFTFFQVIGKCASPAGTKIQVEVFISIFSSSSPSPSQNSTSAPRSSMSFGFVPMNRNISSKSSCLWGARPPPVPVPTVKSREMIPDSRPVTALGIISFPTQTSGPVSTFPSRSYLSGISRCPPYPMIAGFLITYCEYLDSAMTGPSFISMLNRIYRMNFIRSGYYDTRNRCV